MAADEQEEPVELEAREAAALEVWTALTPPPGFADRVMAARERALGTPKAAAARRRRWPYAAVAAAVMVTAAAGAALYVATRRASPGSAGDVRGVAERTTAELGDRGVAVVEPGAVISWKVDGGAAEVEQSAGDVFYRVDRGGGAFVVHTPAGDVRVTGTCFRIEVGDMQNKKQMVLSGAVGAAIAAAVVITVYEGRVVAETKHAKTEIAAGTRATIGADGTAVAMAREAGAAGADGAATKEELLARTQAQRTEIAQLRTKVEELEKRSSAGGGRQPLEHPDDGLIWHDPSPETLKEWAKECMVRVDQPSLERFNPLKPGSRNDRGLEASEIEPYNAAMTEMAKQLKDVIRGLYVETTGDTVGAETLSADAMRREIEEKSNREELGVILQKLSAERAGLQPLPADLGKTSTIERFMRFYLTLGDAAEAALAKRLGVERAKAIRGSAWESRSSMSGCPGSGDR
ncbi:MAG: FecR domain-containing protein [Deltaproteobacteria bacterium]|nr:FecR domain-containing protein [Deltaproteobacteria bacterium]